MFRCVTELKGLAVDVDSFAPLKAADRIEINTLVSCAFLTTNSDSRNMLKNIFGVEKVIQLEEFERDLIPNKKTHVKVLTALGVKNTEMAYVSCNHSFLKRANSFLSGTIWVTQTATYQQASVAPDLFPEDIADLKNTIKNNIQGFFGELIAFPSSPSRDTLASMLPVDFEVDGQNTSLYTLGRYFGYAHYMNQLHPYSKALYLNKKPEKSYTGAYDCKFEQVYETAINSLKDIHKINCVCSVPTKPGKSARFESMLNQIAKACGLINVGEYFRCIREYPDQKTLSKEEREQNVKGVFHFDGNLTGSTVALIDDIISTGSTVKECVRELKRKGAKDVVIVTLAINQFGNYWSSDNPKVECPECHSAMSLLINGTGDFFYSCHNCFLKNHSSSMNFKNGWKQLCSNENLKMEALISQAKTSRQADELNEKTYKTASLEEDL